MPCWSLTAELLVLDEFPCGGRTNAPPLLELLLPSYRSLIGRSDVLPELLLVADSAEMRVSRSACRVLLGFVFRMATLMGRYALPAGKSQLLACCWPCRVWWTQLAATL